MGDPNDDDDDDNDDDIVEEVVEETMEDMMDEDNEESIISTTGHSASSGKNLFDVGIVSKPPTVKFTTISVYPNNAPYSLWQVWHWEKTPSHCQAMPHIRLP